MVTAAPDVERAAVSEMADFELARRSFANYLDWAFILEPPRPAMGIAGGKIPFEKWDHTVEFAEALGQYRLFAYLKARQLGFTWECAAFASWLMRFHPPANCLGFSKTQREAMGLITKTRFILENLPEAWRVPFETDSTQELVLGDLGSRFTALPSTKDSGRSEAASLLILDEADFQEYFETTYMAAKPTIDAGGYLIMGSTSNKRNMSSLFKETYRTAVDEPDDPQNQFKKLFFGWRSRPGRNAAWYKRTKDNIPAHELVELGLTPDSYMEQEYPDTEEEALKPAKTLAHFDQDVLHRMEQEDARPGEVLGPITYFQKFGLGRKYIAGTDVSHGVGGDYSVTVVIDLRNGVIVADCMSNQMEPDEYTEQAAEMLQAYRNPLWAIEDNDRGAEVIKMAERIRYPRLYKRRTSKRKSKLGWHTDGSNRHVMWGELAEAVRNRHIVIPNRNGLQQFYSVIQDPHTRRPEAMKGAHDDYPTACAIAWQMRDAAYGMPVSDKILSLPRSW